MGADAICFVADAGPFQVRLGNAWHDFETEEDDILKHMFATGEENFLTTFRGQQYEFDFERMEQRNLVTGSSRQIRPPAYLDESSNVAGVVGPDEIMLAEPDLISVSPVPSVNSVSSRPGLRNRISAALFGARPWRKRRTAAKAVTATVCVGGAAVAIDAYADDGDWAESIADFACDFGGDIGDGAQTASDWVAELF